MLVITEQGEKMVSPLDSSGVKLFIPGFAKTKGSTHSFNSPKTGKIVTVADCKGLKSWQSLISSRAHDYGIRPTINSVRLDIEFHLPRPKGHFKASGNLRESAPRTHAKKPDLDKLVRAILDSLTGIAYQDDSQVNVIYAVKSYIYRQDEQPGVSIEIWR